MKNIFLLSAFFVFLAKLNAQNVTQILDGSFIRENNLNKQPISYTYEAESYMMWSKRIWRILDLREKINHPIYYPIDRTNSLRNLVTVIRDGICAGELTAYEGMSDEFDYAMNSIEACKLGETLDTLFDDEGKPIPISEPFPTYNIRRYRIKEDWFFNSKRSAMEARIIGICPVEEVFDAMGEYKGDRPLFWIYMPELRHTIASAPAPNPHSDVERRTYDEIFQKRRFSSYVIKEANVYGRKIDSYAQSINALLESKRIKNEIFTFEQDLWEY